MHGADPVLVPEDGITRHQAQLSEIWKLCGRSTVKTSSSLLEHDCQRAARRNTARRVKAREAADAKFGKKWRMARGGPPHLS